MQNVSISSYQNDMLKGLCVHERCYIVIKSENTLLVCFFIPDNKWEVGGERGKYGMKSLW